MSLCNTKSRYGTLSKLFHGLAIVLVIGLLIVGTFMGDMEDKNIKGQVYMLHKSFGLIVLLLGILFLLWSSINTKPKYSVHMLAWEIYLARTVHFFLYALLIGMPLSGWIMSSASGRAPNFFGLIKLPMPFIPHSKALANTAADTHYFLAWTLTALIALHFIGAIKHHWIDKNDILKRMF